MKNIIMISLIMLSVNVEAKSKRSSSSTARLAFFAGTSLLTQSTTPVQVTDGTRIYKGDLQSTYQNTWSAGLEFRYMSEND